jgi:hypothetical protein
MFKGKKKQITRYLLSQDGINFYGIGGKIVGLTEVIMLAEINTFPKPDEVSFYELVKLP